MIAEDLGLITPDVRELMRDFEIPGMKVLLFSFGDDQPTNPYTIHNLERNCVAYTALTIQIPSEDGSTQKLPWIKRKESGSISVERLPLNNFTGN